jgi:hypothetical protein
MANINESIEQLTVSLQELTTHSYNHVQHAKPLGTEQVSVQDLRVSEEVELFVETTRAYADKTRNVSVGSY